ncbi:hypothetical protein JOE11_002138 [Robbsia andropogonis]|uniref:hypothetical protein n=1 Tax=Robbsia andropogonis TaxID=28092 RepID=UPI000616F578|nr:hypothetical protein [Robbsia andropogonis]MCP1129336.1 hypothetical protein [Robbsia andropogonis]
MSVALVAAARRMQARFEVPEAFGAAAIFYLLSTTYRPVLCATLVVSLPSGPSIRPPVIEK